MKDKIITRKKYVSAALLAFALAVCAVAQEKTFRVGDAVKTPDGRQCKIESVTGRSAKVRCGPDRGDVRVYRFDSLENPALKNEPPRTPLPTNRQTPTSERQQLDDEAQTMMRQKFDKEASQFFGTLALTARAYNPKYKEAGSFTINAALTEKIRADLEGLNAVCQKYPNLPNSRETDPPNIRDNPADLCEMAANPEEMTQKATGVVAGKRGEQNITRWINKLAEPLNNRNGYVKDDIQTLLYNRAEWERTELDAVKKRYASLGNAVPPEVLAPLNKKTDELKAQIERDAPNRSWTQPLYSDAALEAMVKKALPVKFPGVKILKIGMTSTTWKPFDEKTMVASDSEYTYYRIEKEKHRFKLGLVLIKLPNQPFCQIRDFQLQQEKAGAGYSAAKVQNLGFSGVFVKCP